MPRHSRLPAMDQFSYLSVLLSIVLGLAITQVLKGFRGILLSRARIQFYWPTVLWSFNLLLIFVQGWWAMFEARKVPQWTFPVFGVVILQTILSYMLGAIVLPDFFGEQNVDLRRHYFEHRRWFFGIMVLLIVVSIVKTYCLEGHFARPLDLCFQLVFMSASAMAALTRNDGYHKFNALLGTATVSIYIALLFVQLK
jgi:hypothetical protein